MKLTTKLNNKRNPVAATLRNFKASKHKSKRPDLKDLHAWHDMVEATNDQQNSEVEDIEVYDFTHWRNEVYSVSCGSYWND